MTTVRDADYWSQRYTDGDAPWDLGLAAPALAAWLEEHPGEGRTAIVPGCGRGHDALALAKAGWAVTAVDFAPEAVAATRAAAAAAGVAVDVREADLFALAGVGPFDLWFEHTCFCAIDPAMRPRYAEAAARLVRPGGLLAAVFFTHGEAGGPPYDVRPEAIAPLFAPAFRVERLAPVTRSVERRRGEETWGELRRGVEAP